jgi:gliding motility-associated-like protein
MNWKTIFSVALLFSTSIGYSQFIVNAGTDYSICLGDTAYLGGSPTATGGDQPYTYTWTPTQGLNNANAANPFAQPTATTQYTVVVRDDSNRVKTDIIVISVNEPPTISAGNDVTIYTGQSTQLQGTGGVSYVWWPNSGLSSNNVSNPSAFPNTTTTYYVAGFDANGCVGFDNVVITVIETDSLFTYNAFSPNADGDNDFWIIGNIEKFPENSLFIYNRYGREVYRAKPYINNWSGRSQGEEVPAGTYYYIIDTGTGKALRYGSVTIVR